MSWSSYLIVMQIFMNITLTSLQIVIYLLEKNPPEFFQKGHFLPVHLFPYLFFFLWGRLALSQLLPLLLFLLRKTAPELTSVPVFLYFICGTPTTAWLDKWCHVCTWDLNQQTLGCRSGTCDLTAVPLGWPRAYSFNNSSLSSADETKHSPPWAMGLW